MFGEEWEPFSHKIDTHKSMTHKEIYNDLISKQCEIPEEKFVSWCKDLKLENLSVDEIDWAAAYRECFGWTQSVQLRSFGYRFRVRILLPKNVLFKMGIVETSDCHRCISVVEDTVHMFWECTQVKKLWGEMCEWINYNCEYRLDMDPGFFINEPSTGAMGPTT